MNLRIMTENQGMAVSKSEIGKKIDIYLSNETRNTAHTFSLLHETLMEGQALTFSTKCSYVDINGLKKDCSSGTPDSSKDVPYKFPIEFVTSTRRVIRSFTMGRLYFMLDNFHQLVVSRLPAYQKNLDSVDGMALIKLY